LILFPFSSSAGGGGETLRANHFARGFLLVDLHRWGYDAAESSSANNKNGGSIEFSSSAHAGRILLSRLCIGDRTDSSSSLNEAA
jgi:hypothetical protein